MSEVLARRLASIVDALPFREHPAWRTLGINGGLESFVTDVGHITGFFLRSLRACCRRHHDVVTGVFRTACGGLGKN